MIVFLISTALVTAIAIALMIWPLLRGGTLFATIDRNRLNADLLKDEFAALERDHATGAIGNDDYVRAHDDLTRRLLEDSTQTASHGTRLNPRSWAGSRLATGLAIALILPVSGSLLYVLMGTPGAVQGNTALAAATVQGGPAGAQTPPSSVQTMVDSLAAKLAAHPDDPAGWAMLGRSYSVLGRFSDAVAAFGKIGPSLDSNAGWLAEYADALSMTAGGNPVGRPEHLALQALKLDPNNLLALMLAGYAATRRGDHAVALPMLQHAMREVTPGSDDEAFLKDLIRQDQGNAAPQQAAAAGTAAGLRIDVSIEPKLRAQAQGKVLFIIAREPGMAMPLAAVKRTASALPEEVDISDADTLDPSHPLSSATDLEVEARVSANGNAMPASGDLFGVVHGVRANGHAVRVTIDERRP